MDPSIFKAYDIRGLFPQQLDAAVVRRIARAFTRHWQRSWQWSMRGQRCRP